MGLREGDRDGFRSLWVNSIRRVELRLTVDGDHSEAAALSRWLTGERTLRGHLRREAGNVAPGEMGGTTDIVVELAGAAASGVLTVLTQSLVTFAGQRRRRVTVEVTAVDGTRYRVEASGADDAQAIAADLARLASGNKGKRSARRPER